MAIALVSGQVAANGAAAATTTTATLPSAPTTGNLIIAAAVANGSGRTFTVSNNHTFTATTSSPFAGAGGPAQVGIFYLQNVPASSTAAVTFTITGGNSGIGLWVAEFSGAATSGVYDSTTGDKTQSNGGPGTTINTPSITPANTGSLLISIASAGGTISAANSPWTGISTVQQGDYAAFDIQTSIVAQSLSFAQSPSGNWDSIASAFIAAVSDILAASPGKRFM